MFVFMKNKEKEKFVGDFEFEKDAIDYINKKNKIIFENNFIFKYCENKIFNLINDLRIEYRKNDEFFISLENNNILTKREKSYLSFIYIFEHLLNNYSLFEKFKNSFFWDKEKNKIYENLEKRELIEWFINQKENIYYSDYKYFIK